MSVRHSPAHLSVALALAGALLGAVANRALADDAAARAAALDLGTQAYVYGIRWLNMDKTFKTQTSVNVSDGRGNAPVNQFSHARHLASPDDHTVVAPNHDTLYSIAWLDLKMQPIVLHVRTFPTGSTSCNCCRRTKRTSPTSALPRRGVSPATMRLPDRVKGTLKPGLTEIKSPYNRVWVLGRTLIRGAEDEPAVQAVQDQYTLTSLRKWGKAYTPKPPKKPDTDVNQATIPGTQTDDDPSPSSTRSVMRSSSSRHPLRTSRCWTN